MFSAGWHITANLRALIESNNMVNHTLTVLGKLDETLALLTDANQPEAWLTNHGDLE